MSAHQPLAQAFRRTWLKGGVCLRPGCAARRIAPAAGRPFDATRSTLGAPQLVVPAPGGLRHALVEYDLHGPPTGAGFTLFCCGTALQGFLPSGDSAARCLA